MKKIPLLATLLMPLLLSAQSMPGQKNKSVIVFLHPLQGQIENFEKGLTQHNQTFHNGKDPIDVFEIVAGESTGEFAFAFRTPYSWSDVETISKSTQDKAHAADWDQNVGKYITTTTPRMFFENSDDSYLPANISEFGAELTSIYDIEIVPGKEMEFYAGIKKIKEMFKKNNSKEYYLIQKQIFGKGSHAIVIIPLPKGWESFEPNPDGEWPKMFKKAFPNEDFSAWIKKFDATQKSFNSFVVKLRKDLSSPM